MPWTNISNRRSSWMFNLTPKFVKKYINLNKIIKNSIKKYKNDVRRKKFPSIKNLYN